MLITLVSQSTVISQQSNPITPVRVNWRLALAELELYILAHSGYFWTWPSNEAQLNVKAQSNLRGERYFPIHLRWSGLRFSLPMKLQITFLLSAWAPKIHKRKKKKTIWIIFCLLQERRQGSAASFPLPALDRHAHAHTHWQTQTNTDTVQERQVHMNP